MSISAATLNITTQIVGANIVTDALYKINSLVQQGIAGAEQSFKNYESLSLSLKSLVASELLRANSTLAMGEAMLKAEGQAKSLLNWTQRLAIESPFTQQGVASAFRMAQAYGFVSQSTNAAEVTSKRLTKAVIDYATASGRGEEVMSRVALALGQIKAKGQLAGGEVLQLTEAGINVRDILARAFGKTTDEIVRMQERGLIPANKAIQAIVEGLERNYAGAAQASAGTLEGLQASLSDIVEMTQRQVTMPLFQVYQKQLADFVGYLQSTEMQVKVTTLAEQGRRFAEGVASIVEGAKPSFMALVQLAERTAGTLGTLVGDIGGLITKIPGLQSGQQVGENLIHGVLALGAALQFRNRMEQTLARNAQRRAEVDALVAQSQDAVAAATKSHRDAQAQLIDLQRAAADGTAGPLNDVQQRIAAGKVQAANIELTQAELAHTRTLAQAKTGLGASFRNLTTSIGAQLPALAQQGAAMALVAGAAYMAMQAWQQYTQQLDKSASTVFAKHDADMARLEKLLRGGGTPATAQQAQADALMADAEQQLADLRQMRERFTQETAEDAQKAAMVQLAADLGNSIANALMVPFKLVAVGFGQMIRDMIAAIPGTQDQVAQLDASIKNLWEMKVDSASPLTKLADETMNVAVANAQARESALRKAEADTEAAIKAQQRAQAEATLAMELSREQNESIGKLAQAEIDYQEGVLSRQRAHNTQLAEMARSHGKAMAAIEKSRRDSIVALAKSSAKDSTSALESLINADMQFRTGLEQRRTAFDEETKYSEAMHQEEIVVLRKQGAIRELRRREREWGDEKSARQQAFRQQERMAAEAYATQLAQQQQHLGRMLIDYIRAQGTMMGVSGASLDAMTSAIAKEYGLQQTLAERSFGRQKQALDGWLASGGRNMEQVIGQLGQYRDEAVKTQMEIDQATKNRTSALQAQFEAGALTMDQYVLALQNVPREIGDQFGTSTPGPQQSERLNEIEKNAREQRAAQRKAYGEQLADAKKSFADQEKSAFESYVKQRMDLEKHLLTMTKMYRDATDERIKQQVRAQVFLNAQMRRELEDLYKLRDKLSPEEFDRRMRLLSQRGAQLQAEAVPDATKPARQPNTVDQLQRDYGAAAPRRAFGGTIWPGTTYLTGERGPELIRPLTPGYVFPNGSRPGVQGGRMVHVSISNVTVDSEARLQQLVARARAAVMDALNSQLDTGLLNGINV